MGKHMGNIGKCGKHMETIWENRGKYIATSDLKPYDHMIYIYRLSEINGGTPWKNQLNPRVNHHIPRYPAGSEGIFSDFSGLTTGDILGSM
jgi:hypothetical protein